MASTVKQLLVLSNVRWEYLWQRQHSLAAAAAADGWRVVFVDPHIRGLAQARELAWNKISRRRTVRQEFRKTSGVTVERLPLETGVLPISRLRARRRWPGRFDATLLYLPSWPMWRVANEVDTRVLVYDKVVDWHEAPAAFYPPSEVATVEGLIYARSRRCSTTHCVTDSPEVSRRLRNLEVDAEVIPPAADPEFLITSTAKKLPIVGFFGAVRDEVDADLLAKVAAHYPTELIGPVPERQRRLLEASGAHLRGTMDLPALVRAAARWSVVVLPYKGERTSTLAPAKLFNSFALGGHVAVRGIELPSGLAGAATRLDPSNDVAVRQLGALMRRPMAPLPASDLPSWSDRWEHLKSVAGIA